MTAAVGVIAIVADDGGIHIEFFSGIGAQFAIGASDIKSGDAIYALTLHHSCCAATDGTTHIELASGDGL